MVPWYLLIIAGEIGIFIGFIITAFISFRQMKKLQTSFSNSLPIKAKQSIATFTSTSLEKKENYSISKEKSA